MAVKQQRSAIGLLLLLFLFFCIGVFISFGMGAAQRSQDTRSKADISDVDLSFSVLSHSNGLVLLSLQGTTSVGIKSAQVEISFPQAKLKLDSNITTHASLSAIISKSTVAQANSSGKIQFNIQLPANAVVPLTGTFELARIPFEYTSGEALVSLVDANTTFKNIAGGNMTHNIPSYTISPEGMMCGGIAGLMCPTGYNCIYSNGSPRPPHADASGTCQSDEPKTTVTATPSSTPVVTSTHSPTPTATLHPTITASPTPTTFLSTTVSPTPSATPILTQGTSPSPTPTVVVTPSPTPLDNGVVGNPPSWWWIIPQPLRNFLEQLYVWVFLFRQPTGFMHLLEGLPTPTP